MISKCWCMKIACKIKRQKTDCCKETKMAIAYVFIGQIPVEFTLI